MLPVPVTDMHTGHFDIENDRLPVPFQVPRNRNDFFVRNFLLYIPFTSKWEHQNVTLLPVCLLILRIYDFMHCYIVSLNEHVTGI